MQIKVLSATDLNLDEPEETEDSFVGNALLKARHAVEATGLPALADDSGLAVSGLDGDPGIYSARWAGPERDFSLAMRRVTEGLERRYGSFAAAPKEARFVCVLALMWPDGHHELFEGQVNGQITQHPRGSGGFGYDPIFIPEGKIVTFGEMEKSEKQQLSHRSRAVTELLAGCFSKESP